MSIEEVAQELLSNLPNAQHIANYPETRSVR